MAAIKQAEGGIFLQRMKLKGIQAISPDGFKEATALNVRHCTWGDASRPFDSGVAIETWETIKRLTWRSGIYSIFEMENISHLLSRATFWGSQTSRTSERKKWWLVGGDYLKMAFNMAGELFSTKLCAMMYPDILYVHM